MTSWRSSAELSALGLRSYGADTQISRLSSFNGASRISLGSNVRIDDFCSISAGEGGIVIGDWIHIAAATTISGDGPIRIDDFCGISGRCSLTSGSVQAADAGPIHLESLTLVGTGSTILPATTLAFGSVLGAMSLAQGTYDRFGVYVGSPARKTGSRSRNFIEQVQHLTRDL